MLGSPAVSPGQGRPWAQYDQHGPARAPLALKLGMLIMHKLLSGNPSVLCSASRDGKPGMRSWCNEKQDPTPLCFEELCVTGAWTRLIQAKGMVGHWLSACMACPQQLQHSMLRVANVIMHAAMHAAMRTAMHAAMHAAMHTAMHAAMHAAMGTAMHAAMRTAMHAAMYRAMPCSSAFKGVVSLATRDGVII
eukprot:1161847-Pelagomonas_calceolata.AAC.5